MVEDKIGKFWDEQRALLKQCEGEIQKGQLAFLKVANAVSTICREKLYRPQFETAADYFKHTWDMSPADVSRYKNAAEILLRLECKGFSENQLPQNEGQARALREIEGVDKQLDVWTKALASGEKITAALITKLAQPYARKPIVKGVLSESKKGALSQGEYNAFLDAIPDDSKKCSAVMEIQTSSALADACEYRGMPCRLMAENLYSVTIKENDRASLFHNIASWDRVYDVKRITITFD